MKRLFAGIAVPPLPPLLRLREQLMRGGSSLRWSEPSNWHVTLQFYGAVGAEAERCLIEQLQKIQIEPFKLGLGAVGSFESSGILYVAVTAGPELERMQRQVTALSSGCGFLPEERPYRPHVTIARRRGRSGAVLPLVPREFTSAVVALASFEVRGMHLYESKTGGSGAVYQAIASFGNEA